MNATTLAEKDNIPKLKADIAQMREEHRLRSYHSRNPGRLLQLYMLTDTIALMAGFLYAWGIAATVNGLVFGRPPQGNIFEHARLIETLLIASGVLLWFQHTGHYRMRMPFWIEVRKVSEILCFAMLMDGFLQFAFKQDFSRLWLMLSWVIAGFSIITLRALVRDYLRKHARFYIHTLLIGSGETAKHIHAALKSEPGLGYKITSQICNLPEAFLQAGASWKNLCMMHHADHIIVALDSHDIANTEKPLAQLARENISFSICPPLFPVAVSNIMPQYFLNHDILLMPHTAVPEQSLDCFMRRMLDIVLSGFALLALSPLMLIIAVIVRLDGGPAFVVHKRIGRNGKTFFCLTFRSMVTYGDTLLKKYLAQNPETVKEWQKTQKLHHDPHVTIIGHYLRRSGIDRLPQLINVLRGDMRFAEAIPVSLFIKRNNVSHRASYL